MGAGRRGWRRGRGKSSSTSMRSTRCGSEHGTALHCTARARAMPCALFALSACARKCACCASEQTVLSIRGCLTIKYVCSVRSLAGGAGRQVPHVRRGLQDRDPLLSLRHHHGRPARLATLRRTTRASTSFFSSSSFFPFFFPSFFLHGRVRHFLFLSFFADRTRRPTVFVLPVRC